MISTPWGRSDQRHSTMRIEQSTRSNKKKFATAFVVPKHGSEASRTLPVWPGRSALLVRIQKLNEPASGHSGAPRFIAVRAGGSLVLHGLLLGHEVARNGEGGLESCCCLLIPPCTRPNPHWGCVGVAVEPD